MQHLIKFGSYRIAAGAGWIVLAAGLWWLVSSSVWGARQDQGRPQRAADSSRRQNEDDDELKSRIGRALSEALDDEDEGDDDQRDLIRQILKETDQQLVEILDRDPREAIRAANQPLQLPDCLTEPCGPLRAKPPATGQSENPPSSESEPPAEDDGEAAEAPAADAAL